MLLTTCFNRQLVTVPEFIFKETLQTLVVSFLAAFVSTAAGKNYKNHFNISNIVLLNLICVLASYKMCKEA